MTRSLTGMEILEDLKMLADWMRVKYPGERFELVVVGGAAMAIEGFKDQTKDIDVIRPEVLPEPIKNGTIHVGRIRKDDLHLVLKQLGFDFNDIYRRIE